MQFPPASGKHRQGSRPHRKRGHSLRPRQPSNESGMGHAAQSQGSFSGHGAPHRRQGTAGPPFHLPGAQARLKPAAATLPALERRHPGGTGRPVHQDRPAAAKKADPPFPGENQLFPSGHPKHPGVSSFPGGLSENPFQRGLFLRGQIIRPYGLPSPCRARPAPTVLQAVSLLFRRGGCRFYPCRIAQRGAA